MLDGYDVAAFQVNVNGLDLKVTIWHLDEVFVRIHGETHCLWRAVDHEGEVLEVLATSVGIAGLR